MKKLLTGLFLLSLIAFSTAKVQALSFEEALQQKKPCAVVVYAKWADDVDAVLQAFSATEQQYAQKYNFVKINIGEEEAKSFNQTNYIYPNLPYILLFKERGRMSRCITKDCIMNGSCMTEKMDLFAD